MLFLFLVVYEVKFLCLIIDLIVIFYRLLTGIKIKSEEDALKAMQCLHDKGPKTVVLSSTNLGSKGKLIALASTIKGNLTEFFF